MNIEQLSEFFRVRLRQPLPGPLAHEVMRATPIGIDLPDFSHQLPPKPGSVMILMYPSIQGIMFPLIKRPVYTGAHSGQISLPGGKAEAGEDAIECALRECEEEIGVAPEMIDVIGQLSEFYVIPSNFMVTPVVGICKVQPEFRPDQREVDKVITAALEALIAEEAIRTQEILAAGRFRMEAPHFIFEEEIVWGATAMMLNELRTLLLQGPR